jgi:hypothetical protein
MLAHLLRYIRSLSISVEFARVCMARKAKCFSNDRSSLHCRLNERAATQFESWYDPVVYSCCAELKAVWLWTYASRTSLTWRFVNKGKTGVWQCFNAVLNSMESH